MRRGNERGPKGAVLYTRVVTRERRKIWYLLPRRTEALRVSVEREPCEPDGTEAQRFDDLRVR